MTTENAAINCPMIEVSGLTKRYENRTAVEKPELQYRKGAYLRLPRPERGGKVNHDEHTCGCLAASEGDVKIGGYDIFDEALKAKGLSAICPNSRHSIWT
jgi:ABC-type lipopolysaccharide export system ATPase subunit